MMRYKLQTLLWLAIIFSALSCKKDELPPDIIGNTSFESNFSFDGNPYQLIAGEDGLSMEVDTYFLVDTIVFESDLDTPECENCGPALYLQLKSPELVPEWGNDSFQSKLENWEYSFAPNQETDTTLTVSASSSGNEGLWYLNNEIQNAQPSGSIEFEIPNFGSQQIRLEQPNLACGNPAIQVFEFNGTVPCYANISASPVNPNNFFVQTEGGFGNTGFIYTWTYGDSTIVSLLPTLSLPPQSQIEELCVTILESGACSQTVCINLPSTPIACVTNFTIDSMEINSTMIALETALISLTFIDENNVAYTSSTETADQPSFTSIELLDASPYTEPNEPSRAFIKLSYEIHCMLYDAMGNGKEFNGIVETAFEDPGL